jgi:hypothetical protein
MKTKSLMTKAADKNKNGCKRVVCLLSAASGQAARALAAHYTTRQGARQRLPDPALPSQF